MQPSRLSSEHLEEILKHDRSIGCGVGDTLPSVLGQSPPP